MSIPNIERAKLPIIWAEWGGGWNTRKLKLGEWKTMAEQHVTTYTLRVKHGMSHATVQRLQADMPISTHTLDKLCTILHCRVESVLVHIPDAPDGKEAVASYDRVEGLEPEIR